MDDTRLYPLVVVAMMIACAGFGFKLGREGALLPVQTRVEHTADTLYVRDTIRVETPGETRTEYLVETIRVPVRDTLWKRDTLFVEIPRERKFYKEEDFYAEVSGYRVNLDYIEVYPRTATITKTERVEVKRRTRWGIGMQVGYGIGVNSGNVYTTPYVGVGISYNLLSF